MAAEVVAQGVALVRLWELGWELVSAQALATVLARRWALASAQAWGMA